MVSGQLSRRVIHVEVDKHVAPLCEQSRMQDKARTAMLLVCLGNACHMRHPYSQYETPGVQDKARAAMPLARLRAAAADAASLSAAMREAPPLAEEDVLAQELLAWFKTQFFTWVRSLLVGIRFDARRRSRCQPPGTQ